MSDAISSSCRESTARVQRCVNKYSSDSSDSESSDYHRATSKKRHSYKSRHYDEHMSKRRNKKTKKHRHHEEGEASSPTLSSRTLIKPANSPTISQEEYKHLTLTLVEETNAQNAKKIAEAVQLLPHILNKYTDKASENEMPTSTSNEKKLTEAVQLLPYILEQTAKARNEMSTPSNASAKDTIFENSCVIKSTSDGFEIRLNTSEKNISHKREPTTKATKPPQKNVDLDIKQKIFKVKDLSTSNAFRIALANQKSQNVNCAVSHIKTEPVATTPSSTVTSLLPIFKDIKPECLFNPCHSSTPTDNSPNNKMTIRNDLVGVDFRRLEKKDCFSELNNQILFKPTECNVKNKDITNNSDSKQLTLLTSNKSMNLFASKETNLFNEPFKDLFSDVKLSNSTNLFETDICPVKTESKNNIPAPNNLRDNNRIENYCHSNATPKGIDLFETEKQEINTNIFESPPKSIIEKQPQMSVLKNQVDQLQWNMPKISDNMLPHPPSNYCFIPSSGSDSGTPYLVIDFSVPPPSLVHNPVSSNNTEPLNVSSLEHIASNPTKHIPTSKLSEMQGNSMSAQNCNKSASAKIDHKQELGHTHQKSLPLVTNGKSESHTNLKIKNERRDPRLQYSSMGELPKNHQVKAVRNDRPRSNNYNNKLYVVPLRRTGPQQEVSRVLNRCKVTSPENLFSSEDWDEPKPDTVLHQFPLPDLHYSTKPKSSYHLPNKINTTQAEHQTKKNVDTQTITRQEPLKNPMQNQNEKRKAPRFTPVRAPALSSCPRNIISYHDLFQGPDIKEPGNNRDSNTIQQEIKQAPFINTNPYHEVKDKIHAVELKSTHISDSNVIKHSSSISSNTIKNSQKRSKGGKINKNKQKVLTITHKVKLLKELASKALVNYTPKQVSVKSDIKIKSSKEINSSKTLIAEEPSMLTRGRKKLIESLLNKALSEVATCCIKNEFVPDKGSVVAIKKEDALISVTKKKIATKKERLLNKQKAPFLPLSDVPQMHIKTKAELKYYPPELNLN